MIQIFSHFYVCLGGWDGLLSQFLNEKKMNYGLGIKNSEYKF